MKEITLANEESCTGCGVCVDICPFHCISMKILSDQFEYPVIDQAACKKCGKCVGVCPALRQASIKSNGVLNETLAYYAWSTMSNVRNQATSGGVASMLSYHMLRKGGYVCGALFDQNFDLQHVLSNNVEDVRRFMGSKYLQSNTRGVYNSIKEKLRARQKVLFIGTSCQVEALKALLRDVDSNELVTVSIICHGVNSPIIWKDYCVFLQQKYKSRLLSYNFRDKIKGWTNLNVSMCFENRKKIIEKTHKNLFHYWFGQHWIMRRCCFDCQYRVKERNSDIVIGDFWGIEKLFPGQDFNKGVSFLAATTQKGHEFINETQNLYKVQVDYNAACQVLKGYLNLLPENKKISQLLERKKFLEFYSRHSFVQVVDAYNLPSFFQRCLEYLKVKLS